MKKWVQGGDWHVRSIYGGVVNLNSRPGVEYVEQLHRRIAELEQMKDKRTRRKPPKPSQNKRGGPSEDK